MNEESIDRSIHNGEELRAENKKQDEIGKIEMH